MAFGLSPRYIQDLPFVDLTSEQFLVIAVETAKKLNWNISYSSETGFIAYTKFSISSWSEEVKVKINGNIANLKSECTGNQMVDFGKNKENIKNFIISFNELKNSFSTEELAQKYEELKTNLVSKENDALNQPPPSTKEKITDIFSIFKPTRGYFITPIIIDLNIAIFIVMVISGVNALLPDNESLIKWGANFRPSTIEGEWWRLITNCFLHIGFFHLLMNLYALLYIGLLLEPHLGKARFVSAYILSGISASVASLCWNELTISAGASGAIFGMYGVFLAMLTTNLIEKSARKALLTSIAVFVGYNLINGLKGGIDNAAHIGGLLSGLVIGYSYIPSLKKNEEPKLKLFSIGLLTIVVVLSTVVVYKKIPNDFAKYTQKMQKFADMESMALELYKMPENTPNDKILAEIKNRGIYYWNENIKLLNDLDKLEIPQQLHQRNRILLQYCELRIKSYELIYKAIRENTDKYRLQIDDYNKQIEKTIKLLTMK
jgi:rhomboid protease GluP